jgi:hypothetical protein
MDLSLRGVKKNRGTGKLENRKPGNRGPDSGSGLEKPKTGYTPVSVPGFWYSVFTGFPETGLNIYIYLCFIFFVWSTLYLRDLR